ncbi:predicted protein [Phaeodactylum tricornutum CCAP 1055/1]|uniref:Uncharacterized protein n=1 Tax=Phaeodactylum tricornutum (strain CCAP 1055/1) TaxID=556484 RepID=B7FTR7_PHATC|nr:predicted protein [Phaeodactylum tricornutum CCAP 1055/1]EEC50129.1 predicted protein [Phaeodactylum tricornutum CCAP 1055/1]|eukprot:XP_002178464.1 predicted protein [Phaeodactylum tricornutum CCAP 1055/1]
MGASLRQPQGYASLSPAASPTSRRHGRLPMFVLAPCRTWANKSCSRRLWDISRLVAVIVLVAYGIQRTIAGYRGQRTWLHAPITALERKCPPPDYPTLRMHGNQTVPAAKVKICLTTLTDEKEKPWFQKLMAYRNYDGLLGLTWDNKQKYADKHGYHLYDESALLDKKRPPAWSKILAAQRLLKEESCDWVVWLDADTVIMNSSKQIEDFLPADAEKDFLIVEDTGGGYNSGVWLIHKSAWSLKLLEEWWGMTSYVRPPGFAKSGDNFSLKNLLADRKDFRQKVVVPPRCTFNSFAKFVAPQHYEKAVTNLQRQEWYMNEAYYHKGDFIAHVAGMDNKYETLAMLLEEAV